MTCKDCNGLIDDRGSCHCVRHAEPADASVGAKGGPMPGFVAGYLSAVLGAMAEDGFASKFWMVKHGAETGYIPEVDLPATLRFLAAFLEQPAERRAVFAARLRAHAFEGCSVQMAAVRMEVSVSI